MAPIEGRQTTTLAVTIAFFVVSSLFVALRLASRIGIVKKIQPDDYFMIAAWIVSFGMSVSICYGTTVGLGRHEVDVPGAWDAALKKSEYAFSVLYNPALMLTKTSILVFYLRLSATERIFKWACIATLAVVNIGGLALTVLNVAQCRPVSSAFKTPIPATAHCTDIVTLYLSSAPLNIVTDLAILFLPFPILTSMNLPRKQKIILLITFGFGVFVAVVDVVRIAYLQEAFTNRIEAIQTNSGNNTPDSRNNSDFSWYGAISYTWSAIEVDVGIMCACVPALKPLVSRFMPHMLRDSGEEDFTRRSTEASKSTGEMRTAQRIPSTTSSPAQHGGTAGVAEQADRTMGMTDFLTTPEMTELPEIQRTQTAMTNTSRHTHPSSPTFFDFVNMQKKKSLVHMTNRESIFPVAMVTILFFIWGFAYGLLDSLNSQFQKVSNMNSWETVGLHSAYFGGYFVAPLTFGRLVFRYWGFKACYMVGLAIYACGTLTFWPAAVLTSFPAFLVSNFIVGMGLSTLEISANPFISLCGPQEYMELRLNLSQGVQAVGSVVAPLLATKVLFKSAQNAHSLTDVQWTYLGISLFTILLAVAYYYVPLPEATDTELDDVVERSDNANDAEIPIPFGGGRTIKFTILTLLLGIFSQWCYVGGQEAISTGFPAYLAEVAPYLDVVNHQAVGHSAFALSRFLAAGLNYWIKARYLLLFFYGGAIVFSVLCMVDLGAKANGGLVIMVYFFEGPIFSIIFAMSLRGLGRRTKDASAGLTAAISGGAAVPPIMHAVATVRTERYAWCVVVAVFAAGSMMSCWVNAVPSVRKIVDPVKTLQPYSGDESSEHHSSVINGGRRKVVNVLENCWKGRAKNDEEKWNEDDRRTTQHREKV